VRGSWSDLDKKTEKAAIIDHYGDTMMPMQMRMLAKSIYGTAIGGRPGTGMLNMQIMMEGGNGAGDGMDDMAYVAHMDMSSAFSNMMSGVPPTSS
jgi:hypothetical protein